MLHGITIVAAAVIAHAQPEPPLAVYKACIDSIPRDVWQLIGKVDIANPGLGAASGVPEFSAEAVAKSLREHSVAVSRIIEASREASFGVEVLPPAVFTGETPDDFTRAAAARRARYLLRIDAGRAWHERDADGAAFRLAAAVRIVAQGAKGPNAIDILSGISDEEMQLIQKYLDTGRVTAKGKQMLRAALERLNPEEPWGMREVWLAEAARTRQWATQFLLSPDGTTRWNDLVQKAGRDSEEWKARQQEVERELDAKAAQDVLTNMRGLPIKYKGYSIASLTKDEIKSKLATSQRLAEDLHKNWYSSAATIEALTKAADEDKSQIIRLTLVHGFGLPPSSVRIKARLRETLDKLNAP